MNLLDLGNRLKSFLQQNPTPAGFAVKPIQQAIQNWGQANPQASQFITQRIEPQAQRLSSFMQQPYKPVQLPTAQVQAPNVPFAATIPAMVGAGAYNLFAKPLLEGAINAPANIVGGVTRTGLNLGALGRNEKVPAKKFVADMASVAKGIMDVSVIPGVVGVGGRAAVNAGVNTLRSSIARGAISGAKFGGAYMGLQSLIENKDVKDDIEYLTRTLGATGQGAAGGAVLGGGIAGVSYAAGKLYGSIYNFVRSQGKSHESAIQITKSYVRNEIGQFAKKTGESAAEMKKRIDNIPLRGMGEDTTIGEYMKKHGQEGAIDFNAKIGKQPSTGGEIPKGVGGVKVSTPIVSKSTTQTGSLIKIKAPETIKIETQKPTTPLPIQTSSKVISPVSAGAKLPAKPGSPSGPIITPESKYAFNINKNKLKLNTEEKAVLDTVVKTVEPELSQLKGKTLTNDEVIKAAKQSEMLQQTVSREQTQQAEAMLLKARQRVVELDKDITIALKSGDTKTVQANMKEYVDMLKVVSSNAADKGRQLQSLSIEAGDESIRTTLLKDIMKVETDTDKLIDEASKVNWDNANSVAQFYRKYIKPSATEIIDEFRYNNMLSNPRTHMRNAFSNMVQTTLTRPATLVAQGKPIEALKYYGGVAGSIPDAFKGFADSLSGKLPIKKPDLQHIPTGKLPKFMTIPTRAMEAGDVFFQTMIKAGERARGATEQQAKSIAEYSLFRQGLKPEGQGKLLSGIDNATEAIYQLGAKVPVFRWFVPFVRTPMNFAKQWLEYSPAGVLTTIGAGNKQEQLAKAVLGSVVTAIGAKAALEDRTTWAAPIDAKEKEAFYASGRKPYSVKIGNNWVSMQYAGPFGLAVALPAAVKYYNDDSRTALTDTQSEKLVKIISAAAEYFSGQTFMEGVGNFVKMASGDIDYTVPKNLAYTASQMIPFQGLVRWVSTVLDPVYRKPSGMIEQVQSNLPFASQQLKPYTMPSGEPSTRETRNLFTPYDITKERPEYNQQLQDRQQKLQENAVKNKLIKDAEAGDVKTAGTFVPVKNSNGNWTTIDTSFQPTPPELTGMEELDKKAISKFNGEITQKANDIYDLYKAGKLTQDEANTQLLELKNLKAKLGAGKKPAKITLKKLTIPKIKLTATRKSRIQNIKIAAAPKPKKIAIKKAQKIKPIKIAKLKGLTKAKALA